MKTWFVLGMLVALGSGCLAEAGDDAEQPPHESLVDAAMRDERPAWEVFKLPQGLGREIPLLAVPKDGRGVPVLLDFEHVHRHGAGYVTTLLASGYVSLADLPAIERALLEKLPRLDATAAWDADPWRYAPEGTVDPYASALGVDDEGRVVARAGSPVLGGEPLRAYDEWDPKIRVEIRFAHALEAWLAAHGAAAKEAMADAPLVPSMASLCADGRARSAGGAGLPCVLVPPAGAIQEGDTLRAWALESASRGTWPPRAAELRPEWGVSS